MCIVQIATLLPFLFAGTALADDLPKPTAPPVDTPPAPTKPAGEEPKKDEPRKEEPKVEVPAIAWLHDYDKAKEQAVKEKKGLFVYLTPSWFT